MARKDDKDQDELNEYEQLIANQPDDGLSEATDADAIPEDKEEEQFPSPQSLKGQSDAFPPETPASLEKEVDDSDKDGEALNKENKADIETAAAPDELEKAPEAPKKDEESELSDEDMAAPAPAAAASPASKLQDYLAEYKRLTEQRRKGDMMDAMIQAGGKIGQSMAGKYSGHFTPDPAMDKMLQAMTNRPVQDFEQGMAVEKAGYGLKAEQAANDPKSPQSKMVRDYLNTRFKDQGLHFTDDVSAADAQMLMKTVGRPINTKFQKVNGSWKDPETGEEKRMSAIFDPSSGTYKDSTSGKALPGFLAEGLNPYQSVVDPLTGLRGQFNKSRGGALTPTQPLMQAGKAQSTQELYHALDPNTRKELNDKIVPNFNKLTEKTQQRLMHQAPIQAKLEEAQLNPAAYAQLQAELARFDVGDQRLAQQEFNMFATRHGYQGWGDWIQKNSTGTISQDFAQDFAHTINNTVRGMQDDLNKQAEKQAGLLTSRLPPGQKVDPKIIAPLIYSGYKPTTSKVAPEGKVHVKNAQGQEGYIPKSQVEAAKKQGYTVLDNGR